MPQEIVANVAIKGSAPLSATTLSNKVRVSELPPKDDVAAWSQWARLVRVDLDGLRAYGEAVQTSVDQLITSLTDTDLSRTVETPFGSSTVLFLVTSALIGHTRDHTGEISCLKGLQGAKGYVI